MYYVTVKESPKYRQMTLDDFLSNEEFETRPISNDITTTHTYAVETISYKILQRVSPNHLTRLLLEFNEAHAVLRDRDRHELYNTFYIPKKSGGMRKICAPEPELMDALRTLKTMFEQDFGILYHTSAYAYIKHRSIVDALKKHQSNESKWFGKFDLHDFFGSTTLDFVMQMFSMVFPFSEVIRIERGREELRKALELAFLDGGLPQGTPISPLITNIMMIPVDHILSNTLRDFNHQRYVYTRYADDFIISSKYGFKFKDVESLITQTLSSFKAPFTINSTKTRYGSSAGSNWNLGLMLNKDNQITVGYQKKKRFKAMLASYVMDRKNGKPWDKTDVQVLDGYWHYYRMVEGDGIDMIMEHIGKKFNVNIAQLIKADLSA